MAEASKCVNAIADVGALSTLDGGKQNHISPLHKRRRSAAGSKCSNIRDRYLEWQRNNPQIKALPIACLPLEIRRIIYTQLWKANRIRILSLGRPERYFQKRFEQSYENAENLAVCMPSLRHEIIHDYYSSLEARVYIDLYRPRPMNWFDLLEDQLNKIRDEDLKQIKTWRFTFTSSKSGPVAKISRWRAHESEAGLVENLVWYKLCRGSTVITVCVDAKPKDMYLLTHFFPKLVWRIFDGQAENFRGFSKADLYFLISELESHAPVLWKFSG